MLMLIGPRKLCRARQILRPDHRDSEDVWAVHGRVIWRPRSRGFLEGIHAAGTLFNSRQMSGRTCPALWFCSGCMSPIRGVMRKMIEHQEISCVRA